MDGCNAKCPYKGNVGNLKRSSVIGYKWARWVEVTLVLI